MQKKVYIQGFQGSNHDMAVRAYFADEEIQIVPCLSFQELFENTIKEAAAYAMVAMENTLAGSLLPNYKLLRSSGLKVLGEYKMRISHNLLALEGQSINDICEVHSHPMALAQCEDFLMSHPHLVLVASEDTALSAKRISDQKQKGKAAIATALAAEMYQLSIIAERIESNPHNFTRFLLIGKNDQLLPFQMSADKASVAFLLPHETGSLSRVLSVLAFYGISLTRIQSLPVIGREWEYMFYADVTFSDYQRYLLSLDAIRPLTTQLEVLGEYASHEQFSAVGQSKLRIMSNGHKLY